MSAQVPNSLLSLSQEGSIFGQCAESYFVEVTEIFSKTHFCPSGLRTIEAIVEESQQKESRWDAEGRWSSAGPWGCDSWKSHPGRWMHAKGRGSNIWGPRKGDKRAGESRVRKPREETASPGIGQLGQTTENSEKQKIWGRQWAYDRRL